MAEVVGEYESLGGTCILVDNIETGEGLWQALEALHTRVMLEFGGDSLQSEYLRVLEGAKERLEALGVEPQEGGD
jgi:hypothetical protein